MATRRIVPLALAVVALLAVVAIAARSGSLGSGGAGSGPSAGFYDYAWTTLVILVLLVFAVGVAALWFYRKDRPAKRPSSWLMLRALVGFAAVSLFMAYWAKGHLHFHRLHFAQPPDGGRPGRAGQLPGGNGRTATGDHTAAFQWLELIAVLGFLLLLGVLLYLRRARPGLPPLRRAAPETLADALDVSLDDLRADPDLRRAIVAAYARMERALAAAGLPRHPAEAPLEYLERALLSLDASAGAVRRLTDLFEWARFSQHEPEPSMRDEAVDALVAVRDELRSAERVAA